MVRDSHPDAGSGVADTHTHDGLPPHTHGPRAAAAAWPWNYRVAESIRTVDGDTFDLRLHKRIDPGFNNHMDWYYASRFRLMNIDVVETNEALGAGATRFADWWIKEAILKDVLRGVTFKSEGLVPDGAFGRWLIDLYRVDDNVRLSDDLAQAGFKKPVMIGDIK